MRVEVKLPIAELFAEANTFKELSERRRSLMRAIVCGTIARPDASNLVRMEHEELVGVALAQAARRMGGGIDPKKLLP